jgi:succinate-semialdehyde dehydrogenase/glutarate-semialdehyde dehydrogenase
MTTTTSDTRAATADPLPPAGLRIAGAAGPAVDGGVLEVVDPATGRVFAEVAAAAPADGRRAVDAAAAALPGWSATAPRARGEALRRAFEFMTARGEWLARLIVRESGKSLADARGEVAYAAEFLRWFAEEAVRAAGTIVTAPAGDKEILALREPVGVCVLVTPWNFPAAMATRKIGPALAAGCTVVLKPASATPLTALAVADLLHEAGVPAGVVNVVPAARTGPLVDALLADPRVRKLSFTGSTEIGRVLLRACAERVVSTSMELGGNAPFVVCDDADLDVAVEAAVIAKMRNGGQSCIAANRFYVHDAVHDAFVEELAARMSALRLGPGLDPATDVGPLIDAAAAADVDRHVRGALARGARVAAGGPGSAGAPGLGPAFSPPTVLVDVDPEDPLLDVEIFGPVAPVVRWHDEDDVVRRAGATEMGLAAYVVSADAGRAMRLARRLDAGVVGINRGLVSDPAAPFGGTRQSGLGREGGHEGLEQYLETKYVAVTW